MTTYNNTRTPLSFADFQNGIAEYKGISKFFEALGKITNADIRKVQNGNYIEGTLGNGMTFQFNRDKFMMSNGTYNSIKHAVVMEETEDKKADLMIRMSYNGEYMAWGFSEDYMTTIYCRDGITRNYYRLAGVQKIAR